MSAKKSRVIPSAVYPSLAEVPLEELRDKGFSVALLDLDNTLDKDHVTVPSDYGRNQIARLQEFGFTPCLVSNAKSTRSADYAKSLDIACIAYAKKPSPDGIFRALKLLNSPKEKAVFFGDQIFTDIIAANRAGIYSVLVEPFPGKEVFYVRLKRPFERLLRKIYKF